MFVVSVVVIFLFVVFLPFDHGFLFAFLSFWFGGAFLCIFLLPFGTALFVGFFLPFGVAFRIIFFTIHKVVVFLRTDTVIFFHIIFQSSGTHRSCCRGNCNEGGVAI